MTELPSGVFLATFSNGMRMRSDAQFVGDSFDTEGHSVTTGELAAMGFVYTEVGGAYIESSIDDRAYRLKKSQSFR
jgi:hypothetical protein